jgi:Tfp pilus assembly protein PilN
MATMKGPKKSVLALFVDGLDVKLAHLTTKGKRVAVQELRSATLASKIEERKMAEAGAMVGADGTDAFILPTAGMEMGSIAADQNNSEVLLGLLAQYPSAKYSLTYSIGEPSLYYHLLESDFGLKGKKLKSRILEELRSIRAFQPSEDAVDAIPTDENNLLCIVREDGLSLLNSLEGIKGFLGGRLPRIPVIDSADVSLMNMVRLNYSLEPHEVTVIVYVGFEFTRLIFMRGNQFFQFAPILGEGYDSPNLANTVYSRLLLEQDNLSIPRIARIVLAGESKRIGLRDFLTQQLPDQEVEYLLAPQVDSSDLPQEQQEMISEYAIPIGAAWRVLEAENPRIYSINLLPMAVQEGQRSLKLGWHGYILLALLFVSTLFFSMSITEKSKQINEQQQVLALKQSQIAEIEALQSSILELEQQLGKFNTSLALYDSIVPGYDRWSKSLTQLSHGVEDLNSIWLTDIASDEHGRVTMNGYTIYRTRIPRLATLFDASLLKEVTVQDIREVPVYKYLIEVPAPAAENGN